jgi:hypothetical protein
MCSTSDYSAWTQTRKVGTDRHEETRGLIGATGITVKRAETSWSEYDDEVKDSVAASDIPKLIEEVSSQAVFETSKHSLTTMQAH